MQEVTKTTHLFVALDFSSTSHAEALMDTLKGLDVGYKVGLELFLSSGPEWVQHLSSNGKSIFLDLKLHDIPNTVLRAVSKISELGVQFTTVHIQGGNEMLLQAKKAADVKTQKTPVKLLGVSVLTSFDGAAWSKINPWKISDAVLNYAELAKIAGLDGMVCSAHELPAIRKKFPALFCMVPGIRPATSHSNHDQARVVTPSEAKRLGANAIVVGRPITEATDPRSIVKAILDEFSH